MLFILILMINFQSDLVEFHLSIDEDYLEALIEYPHSGISYPAYISCSSGSSGCMIRIRGNTSPEFPKKCFAINIDDHSVLGRTRLNINAQYRDFSQMRNGLGMLTSRLLGFPAPLSRHVLLYVNGDYWGVFLDIERVDDDFLERNGFFSGPLFKATDHTARFSWLPTGISQEVGFRPMADSEIYFPDLQRLIDDINYGSIHDINVDMFLSYYAVVLGITDNDGGSMNFYLYRDAEGIWCIFPWDRDSSFGSQWGGVYDPELIECTSMFHLQQTSLFCRLLLDPDYNSQFQTQLEEISILMSGELLATVDSIYAAIRADVYRDTMKQGSNEDFDQAYQELRTYLLGRSSFLNTISDVYHPAPVCSILIEPVHFQPQDDSINITIWTEWQVQSCNPFYTWDRGETMELVMQEEMGSGGTIWHGAVSIEDGCYSMMIAPRTRSLEAEEFNVYFSFFPCYGYMIYYHDYWLSAHPSAVELSGEFTPEDLTAGNVQYYGPDLWMLPLVNSGQKMLDMSLCVIEAGEPISRVFTLEQTILEPGDTLFLTNSVRSAGIQFPGRELLGDCASLKIAGTLLFVLDPSWQFTWETAVPADVDSFAIDHKQLVISEINHSGAGCSSSGDWVEVFNSSNEMVDLGGYLISDSDGNVSMIPWDASAIEPDGFIVLCRDIDRFRIANPEVANVVESLGFGLSNHRETITIKDRCGNTILSFYYNSEKPWPESDNKILSLLSPWLPAESAESWVAVSKPGTPGRLNHGWYSYGNWLSIQQIAPNPSSGEIQYSVNTQNLPVHAAVYDLSGRIVDDIGLLEAGIVSHTWSPQEPISTGIYFLVIRSAGRTATEKFTHINQLN